MTRCGKVFLLLAFEYSFGLACIAQRSNTPAATEEAALDRCCDESAENSRRDPPASISHRELLKSIIHKVAPKAPGLGPVQLDSDVNIVLKIVPDGSVECARAVSGHPFAIASAIQAVPKWRFKPSSVYRCAQMTLGMSFRAGQLSYRILDPKVH